MAITVRQEPASLSWDDFREVDVLPDEDEDGELAQIRPETNFPQNMPVERRGGGLRLGDFTLPVGYDPGRTAVLRTASKTAELLGHEQGHHDLLFLAMRVLARDLEAIRASDTDDLLHQMQEKRGLHQTRASTVDGAYDRETDHGRNREAQARWDAAISAAKRDSSPTHLFSHPL